MLISFLQISFASILKNYKNLLTLGQNLNTFIIFILHYPLIYEKAQSFYDKIPDKAKILLKVKMEWWEKICMYNLFVYLFSSVCVGILVITTLPRSKNLLISWLQSPPVVILEPKTLILSLFPLFLHLFAMKWWDQMLWSLFSECWALSQLFTYPFHFHQESL